MAATVSGVRIHSHGKFALKSTINFRHSPHKLCGFCSGTIADFIPQIICCKIRTTGAEFAADLLQIWVQILCVNVLEEAVHTAGFFAQNPCRKTHKIRAEIRDMFINSTRFLCRIQADFSAWKTCVFRTKICMLSALKSGVWTAPKSGFTRLFFRSGIECGFRTVLENQCGIRICRSVHVVSERKNSIQFRVKKHPCERTLRVGSHNGFWCKIGCRFRAEIPHQNPITFRFPFI